MLKFCYYVIWCFIITITTIIEPAFKQATQKTLSNVKVKPELIGLSKRSIATMRPTSFPQIRKQQVTKSNISAQPPQRKTATFAMPQSYPVPRYTDQLKTWWLRKKAHVDEGLKNIKQYATETTSKIITKAEPGHITLSKILNDPILDTAEKTNAALEFINQKSKTFFFNTVQLNAMAKTLLNNIGQFDNNQQQRLVKALIETNVDLYNESDQNKEAEILALVGAFASGIPIPPTTLKTINYDILPLAKTFKNKLWGAFETLLTSDKIKNHDLLFTQALLIMQNELPEEQYVKYKTEIAKKIKPKS